MLYIYSRENIRIVKKLRRNVTVFLSVNSKNLRTVACITVILGRKMEQGLMMWSCENKLSNLSYSYDINK